jgi:hypothetical protein
MITSSVLIGHIMTHPKRLYEGFDPVRIGCQSVLDQFVESFIDCSVILLLELDMAFGRKAVWLSVRGVRVAVDTS